MGPDLAACGLPLRLARGFVHMDPMPKRRAYDQIKFVAPDGTRALYRSAAALAGKDWKVWVRETLHARALAEHAQRGVEYDDPPEAQPTLPPPLQDRSR